MAFKKVTAIVDEFRLETIELALQAHGVSGFSSTIAVFIAYRG